MTKHNFEYKKLFCTRCGYPHIDEDKLVPICNENTTSTELKNFGKEPHRKHYCYNCKQLFLDPDDEKSISKHRE